MKILYTLFVTTLCFVVVSACSNDGGTHATFDLKQAPFKGQVIYDFTLTRSANSQKMTSYYTLTLDAVGLTDDTYIFNGRIHLDRLSDTAALADPAAKANIDLTNRVIFHFDVNRTSRRVQLRDWEVTKAEIDRIADSIVKTSSPEAAESIREVLNVITSSKTALEIGLANAHGLLFGRYPNTLTEGVPAMDTSEINTQSGSMKITRAYISPKHTNTKSNVVLMTSIASDSYIPSLLEKYNEWADGNIDVSNPSFPDISGRFVSRDDAIYMLDKSTGMPTSVRLHRRARRGDVNIVDEYTLTRR